MNIIQCNFLLFNLQFVVKDRMLPALHLPYSSSLAPSFFLFPKIWGCGGD